MDSTQGIARLMLQAAKRRVIYQLGFISDLEFYLDLEMVRPRTDVERIMLYFDEVDIEFLLPVDGSKTRNLCRRRFVCGVSDATIDSTPNHANLEAQK